MPSISSRHPALRMRGGVAPRWEAVWGSTPEASGPRRAPERQFWHRFPSRAERFGSSQSRNPRPRAEKTSIFVKGAKLSGVNHHSPLRLKGGRQKIHCCSRYPPIVGLHIPETFGVKNGIANRLGGSAVRERGGRGRPSAGGLLSSQPQLSCGHRNLIRGRRGRRMTTAKFQIAPQSRGGVHARSLGIQRSPTGIRGIAIARGGVRNRFPCGIKRRR